jgi:DNA-binding NarL/FixJ family response regulator
MQVRDGIRQYGIKNGFSSNDINVFSLNEQLLFTAKDGIYNFNRQSDSFDPNQFFNKWLGQEQVVLIASDGGPVIYYIQDGHLGRLIQESFGTFRIEKDLFKHINKFMNDDLPNVSIIDAENILIGAKEGFIKYDPSKPISTEKEFPVLLRSLEVKLFQDSSVTYDPAFLNEFQLTNNPSLKFQFAATHFDGFEEIKYAHRLLPMDDSWSEWTTNGIKEYSFLSPGKYIFEMKALNVYGKESSISSFSFEVLKPWYASDFAIAAYFLVVAAFVLLILLLQRRRHHTEKSMLSQDKKKALEEKDQEINQISIKSRQEISSLMNEKLKSEINLKNDQLTSVTMHFMNSNEFIQDALKKVEANLDKGGSPEEMRNIIKTIYRNLSDNDSWERFAYHFDQVHGGYLKKLSENNVKLSPREIKLAAFLRMNLSSKEISTMLNITERSVELARYRLRKKLKLSRDQNLVEYLIELDDQ